MIAHFSASRFTGGRYHAWLMAEALAEGGNHICVVTNEAPFVAKECVDFPAHDTIELVISATYSGWEERSWDIIILVPDTKLDAAVFGAALRARAITQAKMVFLDYEAPNWFNDSSRTPRLWLRTMWWAILGRQSALILSSTEFGRAKAKSYYQPLTGQSGFAVCPAPINDRAFPDILPDVEKRIILISRLDKWSIHKGTGWILEFIPKWVTDGSTITILGGIDSAMRDRLNQATAARKIRIEFLQGVSDVEKFRIIAASRVLIFASYFEGFGLPPVEAACCGTPCVVTRLPVLEETVGNGEAIFVEQGDVEAMERHVTTLMEADPPTRLPLNVRQSARDRFGFVAAYQPKIVQIFSQLHKAAPPRRRTLELWIARALHQLWSFFVRMVR